jgi:hypothetical protein
MVSMRRAFDENAWSGAGVVTVFKDAGAVDEDVADTGGELVGVIKGRVINDDFGVEDEDVCPASW